MFDTNVAVHPSYLCPGAAVPHLHWHTRPLITGLQFCWFFGNTVAPSSSISHPSPGETHHFSLLHPRAALRWTLRPQSGRQCWRLQRRAYVFLHFSVCYSQCWTTRWSTSWWRRAPCCTPRFHLGGAESCTRCRSQRCPDRWGSARCVFFFPCHSPQSTDEEITLWVHLGWSNESLWCHSALFSTKSLPWFMVRYRDITAMSRCKCFISVNVDNYWLVFLSWFIQSSLHIV